jgi:predicted transposase YbfD/YdcC
MLNKWKKDWPYIRSVVRVTRYREIIGDKPTTTISYYVSNKMGLKAEEMGMYIRDHWWIENKLHHVKDATFREDFTTKRVNPYVFSSLIDIALNVLKSKGVKNIRKTLRINALNLEASIQYLTSSSTP